MSKSVKDITGFKFNRLTVISFSHVKNEAAYWNCICDCGNKKVICGSSMKNGSTKSCGCLHIEINQNRTPSRKHGEGNKTTEYKTWAGIKRRCTNPNEKSYPNYGGRGIKMCTEWLNSYETFLADMGRKPTPQHSIDRIDNNGDYCKENCRWVTQIEQCNNQRNNVIVKHKTTGIIYSSLASAERATGYKAKIIGQQLYRKNKSEFIKLN